MFLAWFDFWREYWTRRALPPPPSEPKTCPTKACNLDDLSDALAEYLESARGVAVGAAKNVEDAEKLMQALSALIERKKQAAQSPD